jgi:hypothetical protein
MGAGIRCDPGLPLALPELDYPKVSARGLPLILSFSRKGRRDARVHPVYSVTHLSVGQPRLSAEQIRGGNRKPWRIEQKVAAPENGGDDQAALAAPVMENRTIPGIDDHVMLDARNAEVSA